jgi:hypothetical protein
MSSKRTLRQPTGGFSQSANSRLFILATLPLRTEADPAQDSEGEEDKRVITYLLPSTEYSHGWLNHDVDCLALSGRPGSTLQLD